MIRLHKNLCLVFGCLFLNMVLAKELPNTIIQQNDNPNSEARENQFPYSSIMNINNLSYWIGKDGSAYLGSPNGTQADFPKFTGGSVYMDGLLWGGKCKK